MGIHGGGSNRIRKGAVRKANAGNVMNKPERPKIGGAKSGDGVRNSHIGTITPNRIGNEAKEEINPAEGRILAAVNMGRRLARPGPNSARKEDGIQIGDTRNGSENTNGKTSQRSDRKDDLHRDAAITNAG
jgi:hypothetical protein